ncbi:VCBS repeat-containing protein [Sporosarcina thermotolerans]|uniref:VCBS repeat-containing protein n=1 Tax=Sporosarcina thermotolerans TaxID=633404 RepID=A0AAW9ACE9_9BACL|nr:VCBS repeat-containing protein [Sporosarcina thermotolerans]MDW0117715.1 VCBS repeat-containing protein [Sporosarcina thermotolerans]
MNNSQFRSAIGQPFIVASANGDVTGDKIVDQIYLTGTKTADSPFIQNITLHIRDGRTGAVTSIPLHNNVGYNPTLFLGDFTGNGVDEILIGITTGGSGGIINYYIVSFVGNQAKFLFDSDVYNNHFQYDVTYQDNYKVEVVSRPNNERYIIDISTRDASYLNEIYDRNGKLKSPITGFVDPLSGLYPVDFDSNGVYELLAYQKISGRYHADGLGYIMNTLGWKNNGFLLQEQYLGIFGAQM